MNDSIDELTQLLKQWSEGDTDSRDQLIEKVYRELRLIARKLMARESPGSTLQPTALVHEAYLKISRSNSVDWQNQVHFMSVAARAMRQVLVDHGRRRQTEKRNLGHRVTLMADLEGLNHEVDVLELDQALDRLSQLSHRQASITELRYFGGLTVDEIAELLDLSVATVGRDWRAARAWLFKQLGKAV